MIKRVEENSNRPIVYITQEAYDKIIYAVKKVDIEVSGFGILESQDPFIINDFIVPKQKGSYAGTTMNDTAVADFVDDYIDKDYQPWQIQRVWIHTHPSGVNKPSTTDMETFRRCFEGADWAIMIIVTKEEKVVCNIHVHKPTELIVAANLEIVSYDVEESFKESLKNNVEKEIILYPRGGIYGNYGWGGYKKYGNYNVNNKSKAITPVDYYEDYYNDDAEDWEIGRILGE